MGNWTTSKKLLIGIALTLLLAAGFLLVTADLAYAATALEGNLFQSNTVSINLNDGEPLLRENELLLLSGVTAEKEFFIENNSPCAISYRLYLADVSGELRDMVVVTIKDGDTVLYSAPASQLTAENTAMVDEALASGQRKYLTACFSLSEEYGNEAQSLTLKFTLCAEAIQAQRNAEKSSSQGG